jgi:hypothetical protein
MLDLKSLAYEMDRGVFRYIDAAILMNEYERLGLTGLEEAIDRIDKGYDLVEDVRSIHNAIEIAYAKTPELQTPFTEACGG